MRREGEHCFLWCSSLTRFLLTVVWVRAIYVMIDCSLSLATDINVDTLFYVMRRSNNNSPKC